MREDVHQGLDPETRERMKKNVVYLGMISVFMLFAGLISGYIVSMGDAFWLKFPLPKAFWVSTVVIIISSITFQLAIAMMKKGKATVSKWLVVVTTLLGIGFGFSQYEGYQQLIKKGAYFVSSVVVSEGRYGNYYEIRMQGDLITVDGNSYFKKGKKLTDNEMTNLQNFAKNFLHADSAYPTKIKEYGEQFSLVYQRSPVSFVNGKFQMPDGKVLERADLLRLRDVCRNIVAGRGDFFIAGDIGKDFHIYYHSNEIKYKNRVLYYKGKLLSKPLQLKLNATKDNATSYLYIITFLHLLHVLGMIIFMLFFTKRILTNEFNAENTIGMRVTATFWHYLGALWVFLLLFLLFIH